MSTETLRQLRWIKWLLAVIACAFAAIAAAFVFLSVELDSAVEAAADTTRFSDKAADLLEQGKEPEVLTLAQEREQTHPKDPNVFWYRAKAHYQMNPSGKP